MTELFFQLKEEMIGQNAIIESLIVLAIDVNAVLPVA
jgi:hypothetical protein